MSYEIRRHVRRNVIKVRLNDDENACVTAFARLTRKQRASLAREWLLAGMQQMAAQEQHEQKRTA